jgi:hypothetical protein
VSPAETLPLDHLQIRHPPLIASRADSTRNSWYASGLARAFGSADKEKPREVSFGASPQRGVSGLLN